MTMTKGDFRQRADGSYATERVRRRAGSPLIRKFEHGFAYFFENRDARRGPGFNWRPRIEYHLTGTQPCNCHLYGRECDHVRQVSMVAGGLGGVEGYRDAYDASDVGLLAYNIVQHDRHCASVQRRKDKRKAARRRNRAFLMRFLEAVEREDLAP